MTVIVHAEDKSGRGDGYYTKSSINEALNNFFYKESDSYYHDSDCEEEISKEDAIAAFEAEGSLTIYNDNGEKITIIEDSPAQKI